MSARTIPVIAVLLFLAAIHAASHLTLFAARDQNDVQAREQSHAWSLPAPLLIALAGEFKGIVADLIVLEAGAQLGMETIRDQAGGFKTTKPDYNWDSIVRLFKLSQSLDPRFQHTYMLAQGWLPWTAARHDDVREILATARTSRPSDWRPAHFIGFNTYYFLGRPGEAGRIFLEEAKRNPNAPSYLAILGARLAMKGGETEAAISLLTGMLREKTEDDPGHQEIATRLQALKGVHAIELAVESYRRARGVSPSSLDELAQSGFLAALPENPYKVPYCLDAAGKIHFDNPRCK